MKLEHAVDGFYNGKNVLVTGGAGFIGSHITKTLCSLGANVTVLDDFSTGSIDNLEGVLPQANGTTQPTFKRIQLIANDICSYKAVLKATKKQSVVFHAAAFVSVPQSVKQPKRCEKINVEGTANILEACAANNVKTVIFSSSAAVYGERTSQETPCNEDDPPNPKSPYAQSKLDGERLCAEYAAKHNLSTASLRYFNVYGNNQNPHGEYAGVVAKFTYNLLNQKSITIYGDGKQTRDFVHVSQVVRANLTLGTLSSLKGDIFNIASGTCTSLLDMLKKLEKSTGKNTVDIIFKPARQGDVHYSAANCKKYAALKQKALTS